MAGLRVVWGRLLIALPALLCLIHASAQAERFEKNGFAYFIDKTPAWVVPSPPAINARIRDEQDTRTPLHDLQINLYRDKPEYYVRYQTTALQRSGLEKISQIYIPFNPAFETITLHDISVIRDGQRISRLKDAQVDMLRREQGLEARLMLDGEVTALVVLSDIRLGDVIDVAYTSYGANPVFGNQFTLNFALNRTDAIGALRLRIVYPDSHKLAYQMVNSTQKPSITREGKGQLLEIASQNVAPVKPEEDVPSWFEMFSWLHISEYRDWAEVNQWALQHFSQHAKPGPALEKVIRDIAAKHASPKERAAAALTFVQNEVRYFGIEIGSSSHVPKAPDQTLTDRYGDCKDKTMLLITMLRRLGIEAHPALVSARRGRGITDRLPSAFSFDHVITQAVIGGNTYWLDGTLRYQGNTLDTLGFYSYGTALVVKPGTTVLTDIPYPTGYANRSDYLEVYRVSDFKKPIALTVTKTYQRQYAEYMRNQLSANGLEVLQRDIQDQFLRLYPQLVTVKPSEIKDDPERNTLQVISYFELPDHLKYENGRLRFDSSPLNLIDATTLPRALSRRFPMGLNSPYQTTHRVELHWPEKVNIKFPPPIENADPFFNFSSRYTVQDNTLIFEQSMGSVADVVPPQQMSRYIERLKKIRNEIGSTVRLMVFNKDEVGRRYNEITRKHFYFNEDGLERQWQKQLANQLISDDIIRSGKVDGKLLAAAYLDRAVASQMLGEHDNARRDIQAALKLEPGNLAAKKAQAEILAASGKFKESLSVIDELKAADSGQEPISLRAKNLFMLGKYREAETLFSDSIRLAATTEAAQYDLLWLALTRLRQGQALDTSLNDLATQTGLTAQAWPGQIWQALRGVEPAEKAIGEAYSDPGEARIRRTEALFYIAQLALTRNETGKARTAFQQILTIGATMAWEHMLAKVELERLGSN